LGENVPGGANCVRETASQKQEKREVTSSREDIEKQLEKFERPFVPGATSSYGTDDTRTVQSLVLVTRAILRLDQTVERLDKSSSHLARVNIALTVVIAFLTAAAVAAALIPIFRK
jgi:hypothetical protein